MALTISRHGPDVQGKGKANSLVSVNDDQDFLTLPQLNVFHVGKFVTILGAADEIIWKYRFNGTGVFKKKYCRLKGAGFYHE